jgi:hypothetical protein
MERRSKMENIKVNVNAVVEGWSVTCKDCGAVELDGECGDDALGVIEDLKIICQSCGSENTDTKIFVRVDIK